MRLKTTFIFLCLLLILLSIGHLDVNANSCASYLSDYLSKVSAYNAALETLQRLSVAVAKKTPGQNIPAEYSDLEDEYDSNPTSFFENLKTAVSVHPGTPSNLSGFINGLAQTSQLLQLIQAYTAAQTNYDTAVTAITNAKTALENCTGMTVVTIWCELGADCQNPPGVQGNPRAHKIYDCEEKFYFALGSFLKVEQTLVLVLTGY